MLVCGACERELPEDSYSEDQRGMRQSNRRCGECVAAGNQLVLMKKGRTRSEEDDCPICSLPLPPDGHHSMFKACCVKRVCTGCILAAEKRGISDCPFCRTPTPDGVEQALTMIQKRVDAGDPMAMCTLGFGYRHGQHGLDEDETRAVELYERAAELGANEAHSQLGLLYYTGAGVERDTAKAIRHWEEAAVKGCVQARHNLGFLEERAGNYDLALQHFLIATKLGSEPSLKRVKDLYKDGIATKADYAEALRGYQSAVEEMRSPGRDEALALGFGKVGSL